MGRELWREGHGLCRLEALSTDSESFPVVFTPSVLFISFLLGVFWINTKRPKNLIGVEVGLGIGGILSMS